MPMPDNNGSGAPSTTLLDGRVTVFQPRQGYRTAVDAVLLAAFCPAGDGDTVLDVGAGNGSAGFCLAERIQTARLTGLELQPEFAELAERGIIANGLEQRYRLYCGDLLAPPRDIVDSLYHHVMCNPPYMKAGHGNRPGHENQITATVEGNARLGDWLNFSLKRCKPGGTVTVIHRADRLADIMAWFYGRHTSLTVLPILPGAGLPPKRVLVNARKSSKRPFQLLPGLVLHDGDGYSTDANKIIRGGFPLYPVNRP